GDREHAEGGGAGNRVNAEGGHREPHSTARLERQDGGATAASTSVRSATLLLGLDFGGLHQLAAHGKTFPDDGGKLALRARRDRKAERGELLLHGIGRERL